MAIMRYLGGIPGWQSKGWIRRKLQADGYDIDTFRNDWLSHVLDALVAQNRLDMRTRILDSDHDEVTIHVSEYRVARIVEQ